MAELVKEKLARMLEQTISQIGGFGVPRSDARRMAADLMHNGVTVQEWISVKERLPKPFVSVLVQMPDEAPCPTVREGFITDKGIWHSAWYDREPDEVTHWMPMPEPPKGE